MSEVTSFELAWSELPFPELPAYEFGYPEFNPMSSSLLESALPIFASPIQKNNSGGDYWHITGWEAAIWECLPYTNIPRLPPELTDRIISFVGGSPDLLNAEKEMLCNCALVCRAWLPASRYHLYHSTLALRSSKCFEALVQTSRASYVAAALRAVLILDLKDSKPAWVHRFPFVLGQLFSAAQELYISDIEWDAVVMHRNTLPLGFRQFGCVTRLTLWGCKFQNFRQFQRLICALPHLRCLEEQRSSVKTSQASPITIAALRYPVITELKLTGPEADPVLDLALLDWLVLMQASIQSLRSLNIHLRDKALSSLRNLLEHAGTQLENLWLSLPLGTTSHTSGMQHLNLGHCTVLRNLALRQVQNISLAEILRTISPNCRLHKLDILMEPGEVDCEWESAAQILDEQQFLTLREFMLDVRGNDFAKEAKRRILDCFDALRQRGVEFRLCFNWKVYCSDSPTISVCQSKTPELQVDI
ncbi:hypothetical protein BKA93DRAFT_826815 [Sparassis latifolia]